MNLDFVKTIFEVRGGNCEKISENQNRRCRENVKQTSSFVATPLDDQVFQQGRFLNVFREDDRGTKALFNFVRQVTISRFSLIGS